MSRVLLQQPPVIPDSDVGIDFINSNSSHKLPTLPYAYSALAPIIDAQTMQLHHDVHHRFYVQQLNLALQKLPALQKKSAKWLLLNSDKLPVESRQTIRNSASGHVNHSLFWKAMSPVASTQHHTFGGGAPTGDLLAAINCEFGSLELLILPYPF
jgi:superoxide dismutase, Fe-Mn family